MQLVYKISIPDPHTHYAKIRLEFTPQVMKGDFDLFLPVWSPGSYMVREYSRHLRGVRASDDMGNRLYITQVTKNRYALDLDDPDFLPKSKTVVIEYEVYCRELTVRTSHIDSTHAFLHGPSLYMMLDRVQISDIVLHLDFPPIWSHVSTTLKDISTEREKFIYRAENYDELLDCPIEIGCQETDGFMVSGKEHWWCYWGTLPPHTWNIKADIQKIVETVASVTGELPYDKYMFFAHFAPGLYGGLEHSNSTILAYDPFKLVERKGYLDWLSLVAHEYFHTWNVKRIRPKELGPFNYDQENYTKLLWLSEGLTVFMDELFVLRAGLSTLSEYLEQQKNNINRLMSTPGRRFHSLEESSFNAWIKLYRPDENLANSSVSYYLKGGLAFFVLNAWLNEHGNNIDDFIKLLWRDYIDRPDEGIQKHQLFDLIEPLSDEKICINFEHLINSTDELPLDQALKSIGLEAVYDQAQTPWSGLDVRYEGERVLIERVILDGPAMQGGLNAGDEIISVGGLRVLKAQWEQHANWLKPNTYYEILVNRHGKLTQVGINPTLTPKYLKEIKVLDEKKAMAALGL